MPTLQVRHLPEHIYQKIVERARAKRRSIAQETVILLQKLSKLRNAPVRSAASLLTNFSRSLPCKMISPTRFYWFGRTGNNDCGA